MLLTETVGSQSVWVMSVPDSGGRGAGEKRPVSGLFVGGRRPVWLVAERGRLLPHPAAADGPASAFTSFHNESCQRVEIRPIQ